MKSVAKISPFLLLLIGTTSLILWAQQPCTLPSLRLSQSEPNIFSSQQEQELGEIIAERLSYLHITDDSAVTGFLTKIGDRLARHLPPAGFRFHYFLMDSPLPNAFSIPGGRIYITRGLIAELRSPDELAAILGHEMGHIVTHQAALETTFLLQQVLGVNHVTDRKDIQRKLDDLEANWRRDRSAFRKVAHERGQDQLIADQVGLYALTAAGFSPEVYPELFKRITLAGNNTGNWLSDLLHTTTPEQLRLRSILQDEQAMPKACIEQHPDTEVAEFQRWRKTVLDFTGWEKRSANLHGVVARVKLQPLTLGTVQYIRFSPDGRYLLAKKDQSIYIFTRAPFAFLFRIYAPDTWKAHFTTDSRSVAFTGAGSRVQIWNLDSRKRVLAYTPQIPSPCVANLLSPDAKLLACVRGDGTLDLIRLPSGKLMLEKHGFSARTHGTRGLFFLPAATMAFSPDGRYFVARGQRKTLALDLSTAKTIHLTWDLKKALTNNFVFLSGDRLLAWQPFSLREALPDDNHLLYESGAPLSVISKMGGPILQSVPPSSVIYRFPSGKRANTIWAAFWYREVAVTRGDYLLVGPLQSHPLGILDLKSGKIRLLLDQPAADVYKGVYAHQIVGGDLGLYDLHTGKIQSRASFPPTENSAYLSATASPSLKWLATPAGAIWNLTSGKMVRHVRRFEGGGFDGDKSFYADFPAYRGTPRTLVKMSLTKRSFTPERKIKVHNAMQYGLYQVVTEPQQTSQLQGMFNPCRWKYPEFDSMDCDVTFEIRDVRTGRVLWNRHFPREAPHFQVEPKQGRVVLNWQASDGAVRDEVRNYPRLAAACATARKRPGEAFVEVLDLANGSVRHAMFVKGALAIDFLTAGRHLLVAHPGYIEMFSLTTGAKEGEIPGWPNAVSPSGNLLTVRGTAPNKLDIYAVQSRKRLDQFVFPADVDFDQFNSSGKRLLVLTRNQIAYILDVSVRPASVFTNP